MMGPRLALRPPLTQGLFRLDEAAQRLGSREVSTRPGRYPGQRNRTRNGPISVKDRAWCQAHRLSAVRRGKSGSGRCIGLRNS